MKEKRKVFISFYNKDILWKDKLLALNESNNIFIEGSVDRYEISDKLTDKQIREIIRDEYIRESSVTIVLASPQSLKRKHIDWEIGASMVDTKKKKKIKDQE